MPYDNFIHQQLAGDLMPHPTKDMIIATAFNRNHQQNMEGGIIEEEFQTEYVMDRTNTFGEAFMALSVGCARCHDHKYDPFSQKNYYQLFSFFNNVAEAGQISWNDDTPTPTLMLPTPEKEKIINYLKEKVDEQEAKIERIKTSFNDDFEKWIATEQYKSLAEEITPKHGLQGLYKLNGTLANEIDTSKTAELGRERGRYSGGLPAFEKNKNGPFNQSLPEKIDKKLDDEVFKFFNCTFQP
jgi:hypothetical protein